MNKLTLTLALAMCLAHATAQNPLAGKTLNVIGDSYVENHLRPKTETWHYKVAKKNGMVYNNYGKNGNCIAFDRTKDGYGKPMYQRFSSMADQADYVLVIAGHNDAGRVAGNADSLEVFKKGLDSLCVGLIEKYPQARIGFVTPWRINGEWFDTIINAIHEVCAKHSIPVLDTKTSGIHVNNAKFRERFFQSPNDNAHLNDTGHDLIVNWGEHFLLSM